MPPFAKKTSSPGTSEEAEYLTLNEECHHYNWLSEVPWDLQKYWSQRHSIFSKYDEGIYMTDDSWFGVTPEPVARQVASDVARTADAPKTTIIDAFAGAGGNTIAFALSGRWKTIIAIEKDPAVMACAQHNAHVYSVFDKITWINDDCFSYISAHHALSTSNTVLFASPPWGGPGYKADVIFNLASMQPYSVMDLYDAFKSMDMAFFLPRTSDLRQIAPLASRNDTLEVVHYCMEGASKGLVVYIPAHDSEN